MFLNLLRRKNGHRSIFRIKSLRKKCARVLNYRDRVVHVKEGDSPVDAY